eukprot:COSAG04_NODE_1113_length_8218_cov_2.688262_1_plen_38_part_10
MDSGLENEPGRLARQQAGVSVLKARSCIRGLSGGDEDG